MFGHVAKRKTAPIFLAKLKIERGSVRGDVAWHSSSDEITGDLLRAGYISYRKGLDFDFGPDELYRN